MRDSGPFVKAVNELDDANFAINLFGPVSDLGFTASQTKVLQKGRLSQKNLINEFQKSDILLYFDNAFGIQTSGKIFELLSLKKPIFFIYSNEKSPILTFIQDYKNVILVKNQKEDILLNLKNLSLTIPKLSFEYDVSPFSWERKAQSAKKLFIKLLKN